MSNSSAHRNNARPHIPMPDKLNSIPRTWVIGENHTHTHTPQNLSFDLHTDSTVHRQTYAIRHIFPLCVGTHAKPRRGCHGLPLYGSCYALARLVHGVLTVLLALLLPDVRVQEECTAMPSLLQGKWDPT